MSGQRSLFKRSWKDHFRELWNSGENELKKIKENPIKTISKVIAGGLVIIGLYISFQTLTKTYEQGARFEKQLNLQINEKKPMMALQDKRTIFQKKCISNCDGEDKIFEYKLCFFFLNVGFRPAYDTKIKLSLTEETEIGPQLKRIVDENPKGATFPQESFSECVDLTKAFEKQIDSFNDLRDRILILNIGYRDNDGEATIPDRAICLLPVGIGPSEESEQLKKINEPYYSSLKSTDSILGAFFIFPDKEICDSLLKNQSNEWFSRVREEKLSSQK